MYMCPSSKKDSSSCLIPKVEEVIIPKTEEVIIPKMEELTINLEFFFDNILSAVQYLPVLYFITLYVLFILSILS